MSSFKHFDKSPLHGPKMKSGRPLGLVVVSLVVLALLVVACGPAAEPTELPAPTPTTAPPAPTGTPAPEAMITPSVTVSDQAIVDGEVTIAEVVSDGPGWLVIHADTDGSPGPILGYAAVVNGANADVVVAIDTVAATETLYAMLHTDGGELGTWEFPNGPDTPVVVEGQVVTPAFMVTGGLAMEPEVVPTVTVADQEVVDGTVVVAEVVSNGPGWLVVHAQADGKPGPILGYRAVADGTNPALTVEIDTANATEILYAMLHTDAGEVGTFEFPNGPDTPVMVAEQMVSPAFMANLQATAPEPAPAATPTPEVGAAGALPAGAVVVTGDEAEVEMEDFQFRPKILAISPGTTVKFANKDDVQHTATSDTGVFDSGFLSKGEEFFFTFTEPGTYPYYCIPHGGPGGVGMSATIIVQP
jgi:plastocyanin